MSTIKIGDIVTTVAYAGWYKVVRIEVEGANEVSPKLVSLTMIETSSKKIAEHAKNSFITTSTNCKIWTKEDLANKVLLSIKKEQEFFAVMLEHFPK